jgi:hypothetical protein
LGRSCQEIRTEIGEGCQEIRPEIGEEMSGDKIWRLERRCQEIRSGD